MPRPRATAKQKVKDLLEVVGLNPEHINRYPPILGSRRQRGHRPRHRLESAGDRGRRAGLGAGRLGAGPGHQPDGKLQRELGLSYLFIATTFPSCAISDRVAVMYLGRFARSGRRSIYTAPQHPYTQALLSAVPVPIRPVGESQAHRADRRPAIARRPTVRLPLPHPVLEGTGQVCRRDPTAARSRAPPPGGLPPGPEPMAVVG